MKRINLGILAHVDAGKTTLNESCLYHGNIIKKMGRVDNGDSFLDSNPLERNKGITIFAKSASFDWKDSHITLVDTPGHKDFLGESERTLQVLDEIVLVISALDGVQSHSETIFELSKKYNLPLFVFVNKMDLTNFTKEYLLDDINDKLKGNFVDFTSIDKEKIALSDEILLEEYLNTGDIKDESIKEAIKDRRIFPIYFGSALKDIGVVELLDGIDRFTEKKNYPKEFGLRIFKVSYDDNNTRWCYGKVTGGSLTSKQKLTDEEKVDQLCIPSSDKFIPVNQVEAGQIVAIKGLKLLSAGSGLGIEENEIIPSVKAYLQYQVETDDNIDKKLLESQLKMLQQEDPSINISYQPQYNQYCLSLMGEIQIEVIESLIKKRSGISIYLTSPKVLYKETITDSVIGYGHFEPLRHYAEVHVLLEPLERNKGIEIVNGLSNDDLSAPWQSAIMNALSSKKFIGVLTGSEITDIRITVIRAKGHVKHTEGGDFRQAAYRAVRNGLKRRSNILLEPYYEFNIKVKKEYVGKVLSDLERMNAKIEFSNQDEIIKGIAPVKEMNDYITTFNIQTSGSGRLDYKLWGYEKCKQQQEIIDSFNYDSELDEAQPTGSIFCGHGSGFYVPYNLVEQYIHIKEDSYQQNSTQVERNHDVSDAELKRVFQQAGGKNRNEKKVMEKKIIKSFKEDNLPRKVEIKEKLLIVDGYNLAYSYSKTKSLMSRGIDSARDILINDVASYGGYIGSKVMIVFDAYKLQDNVGKIFTQGNLTVIYTKSGQSADSYIEKLVHDNIKNYRITVVTSDQAVQNMVLGSGALRMSVHELEINLQQIKINK